MQVSTQLYPTVSEQNGIPFKLEVNLTVPYLGMPITIEKVHLVGNEVFTLCKVGSNKSGFALCAIGTSTAKVTIKLPKEMEGKDVKIHRYVLGKTWGWSDQSDEALNFINNEAEYKKIVGNY